MGFRKAADGVTQTGKTKGRNLGDSGPTVAIENGPKKSTSKLNRDMKIMGRGLAKIANQKRG
jgi:hypothetical protein